MQGIFFDNNGQQISIERLQYNDLKQIFDNNIEEGYAIEFKSIYNDDVKSKLPRIITSFSNSSGGWLFIGINNDGTICDIQKPNGEIYLTIMQKIERVVSPSPKFNARFLENPSRLDYGVIAVSIEEGLNPPYLANGTIYVRSGSSSIPVPAERPTVDYLFKKKDATTALIVKSVSANGLNNHAELQSNIVSNYDTKIKNTADKLRAEITELEKKPISKIVADEIAKKKAERERAEKIEEKLGMANSSYAFLQSMAKSFNAAAAVQAATLMPSMHDYKSISEYAKEELDIICQLASWIKDDVNLDDLLDLDNLQIAIPNAFLSNNDISFSGHDEAVKKYKKLKLLSKNLADYFALYKLIDSLKNKYLLRLVLCNEGNKYDEDITVKLFLPRSVYYSYEEIELDENCINDADAIINKFFVTQETAEIEGYCDYPIPRPAQPPMKSAGTLSPHVYLDYKDLGYKKEIQENELEALFHYEIYSQEQVDIIKVRFSKLLANSSMFFPAPIILNAKIDALTYEISTKHNGMIIKGVLKVV